MVFLKSFLVSVLEEQHCTLVLRLLPQKLGNRSKTQGEAALWTWVLYPIPHVPSYLRVRVWRAWDATEIILGEGDGQVFQIGVGEPEGFLILPPCHL